MTSSPLVTVTNQLILFLSFAFCFWGPPSPTLSGRHLWKPPCACPNFVQQVHLRQIYLLHDELNHAGKTAVGTPNDTDATRSTSGGGIIFVFRMQMRPGGRGLILLCRFETQPLVPVRKTSLKYWITSDVKRTRRQRSFGNS